MSMTVGELIQILEQLDEDTEIRIASQPSWPFEYSISGVTTKSRAEKVDSNEEEIVGADEGLDNPDGADIAYIVEGEQMCYASKSLFNSEAHIFC